MLHCLQSTPSHQWWEVQDALEPVRLGAAKFFVGRSQRHLAYFERQAIVSSTVRCASLVGLLAMDLDAHPPVLIYPKHHAERLDRWLAGTRTRPPQPVLLWMARQLMQGLQTLHAAGFVHGNVRPDTILVGTDYRLWLIGLGRCEPVGQLLARVAEPQFYDPPEVQRDRFESSSARDIFSAARVFSELLGQEFSESSLGEQMLTAESESRPTAGQLVAELLNQEHRLLGQCLRAA